MIIKTDEKFYVFEFGLKGLMLLEEYLNQNEEDIEVVLYCGLIKNHPDISRSEIKQIVRYLNTEQLANLYNHKISIKPIITELYAKAVGEMGIQPSDFWAMSEKEIEWAYEGFVGDKEAQVNLMVMALDWSKKNNPNLIRFTEDKGYQVGSIEDRELTLKTLGIEEEL